jgi:hypothetical protein
MTAEIEAAAEHIGDPHQIATLVRDLARGPLQMTNDTSIKRTSFIEPGGICMISSLSQIVRPRSMIVWFGMYAAC